MFDKLFSKIKNIVYNTTKNNFNYNYFQFSDNLKHNIKHQIYNNNYNRVPLNCTDKEFRTPTGFIVSKMQIILEDLEKYTFELHKGTTEGVIYPFYYLLYSKDNKKYYISKEEFEYLINK